MLLSFNNASLLVLCETALSRHHSDMILTVVSVAALVASLAGGSNAASDGWYQLSGGCLSGAGFHLTSSNSFTIESCQTFCESFGDSCLAATLASGGTCTLLSDNSATASGNFLRQCYSGSDVDMVYMERNALCTRRGARFFEGACYEVFTDRMSWSTAASACASHGGVLATVANRRVQDFAEDLVSTSGVSDIDFWLGSYRQTNSSIFEWIEDGIHSNYSNWLVHPDNDSWIEPHVTPTEECVAMYVSGPISQSRNLSEIQMSFTWGDENCLQDLGYMCKTPAATQGKCQYTILSGGLTSPRLSANSIATDGAAEFAILGTEADVTGFGSWSTNDTHSTDYYIETDLDEEFLIRELWLQGRNEASIASPEWVRSFQLAYSTTGSNGSWVWYTEWNSNQGQPKLLVANSDTDTAVQIPLNHPFLARFVRLYPLGYGYNMARYSMRFELIGCQLPPLTPTSNLLRNTNPDALYRTNFYTFKDDVINADLDLFTDGDFSSCIDVPPVDYHTAWTFSLKLGISSFLRSGLVRFVGQSLSCSSVHHPSGPALPVTAIHADSDALQRDSFEGEFRHCPLLRQETNGPYVTCDYLCSGLVVDYVFINLPITESTQRVCEIEVYPL